MRLLLFGFYALYISWMLWGLDQPGQQFWIGHLTMIFTTAFACYLAWEKHRINTEKKKQKAWQWMGIGFVIWLVQDFFVFFSSLLPSEFNPLPFTSFLYILGGLLFVFGLLNYPYVQRGEFSRPRILWDLTLSAAALIILLWLTLFQPILSLLGSAWNPGLLPIIMDLVIIIVLISLMMITELKHPPTFIGWFILAFIAYIFSDVGLLSLAAVRTPYRVGSFIDIGWVLGNLVIITAIHSQLSQKTSTMNGFWGRIITRIQTLFPIAAVSILGWYVLLEQQVSGEINYFGLWSTLALGLGLLVRQGIIAGEIALEQYARLVNSIAEPAFICDQQGRLRMVNPAFLEIGNFQRNDVIGQPLETVLTFEENESLWWAQILEDEKDGQFYGSERETELAVSGGKTIPVMLSLRPVQSSNSQNMVIAGTAHDLRLQKMQQNELQAAYEEVAQARAALEELNTGLENLVNEKTADLQKAYLQLEEQNKQLQQLDQVKSDFVSLVSHELRAPLTNIRGGIELLLSGYITKPERVNNTLTRVQSEILRLTQFTESILDLSAMDANRLPLYPEPMHLGNTVSKLQSYFEQIDTEHRIQWQIPTDSPNIVADQKALHSILFHLLDNALKYAPEGPIVVRTQNETAYLQIIIQDQGPGISEEALPFLFNRFYRAGMEDSQSVYGHGLGLYLVRRFTEAMNGTTAVQNASEGGAVFSVRLPLVN